MHPIAHEQATVRPGPGTIVVAAAAGLAGVYLLVRHPPARRLAWQVTRMAVTTWIPGWIAAEVREAWRAAAVEPDPGTGA